MLKFQAYFKEAVNESAMENYRTRLVNFMYYLADDKIEITEVGIAAAAVVAIDNVYYTGENGE